MTVRAATGPLTGLRVLDMSRILAGPFAAMQLGDLGADVIKVEPPSGDDSRQWLPPSAGGEAAYYLGVNRNKRSIALNLSLDADRAVLRQLAAGSDVLLENFRVGTMERWSLGYEQVLAAENPGLVYCSITGYGRTGPDAHLPGYDPVIEAVSGLMSITGEPGGSAMKVGVAVIDIMTGWQAVSGILAALHERAKSGKGQRVDVSLLETALSSLANQASAYLISGEVPRRHGNAHPAIVPYQTFGTTDGDVMVGVGNDGQFRTLCRILGAVDLAQDARFATNPQRVRNRDELIPLLDRLIGQLDTAELVRQAEESGVPIAPVNDLHQAFGSEQVAARKMVIEVDHPTAGRLRQVGFPIKLSRTPASARRHPPRLDEHAREILSELGYTDEEADGWLSTRTAS